MDKLIITESDKVLINDLLPSKQLLYAIRKFEKNIDDKPQKNRSIDDLSIDQIKEIIPKISIYVDEMYEFRKAVGNYDEAWMFEYYSLIRYLEKRLGRLESLEQSINESLNDEFPEKEWMKKNRANGMKLNMVIQTIEDLNK